MRVPYFPGCTLNTKAAGYDRSGRAVAAALGLPMDELDGWQCCGATFPLSIDNSMALVAPTRILAQAEQAGDTVATLCALCYNVLKRTQAALKRDPDMLDRINWFTDMPYHGGVRVVHLLELLRDTLTWEGLRGAVRRPLTGLKVAPYYGCLLLRPAQEMQLDDPERPTILGDCMAALGAEVIDFPYAVECCGSYLAVGRAEVPDRLAAAILNSARRSGADAIVTACPLCQFNLDYPQRGPPGPESVGARRAVPQQTGEASRERGLPVLYFTQLMAIALDLAREDWGLEGLYVDPTPLLERIPAREEEAAT